MSARKKDVAAASRFTKIGEDGKPLPVDAEAWVINADGHTGRMWDKGVIRVPNWQSATIKKIEKQLSASRLGGFDDWRIPTVDELFALADRTVKKGPAIDTAFFPGCPEDLFWSSTPYACSSDGAWLVGFNYGGARWYYRYCGGFVRAVRGGQ